MRMWTPEPGTQDPETVVQIESITRTSQNDLDKSLGLAIFHEELKYRATEIQLAKYLTELTK